MQQFPNPTEIVIWLAKFWLKYWSFLRLISFESRNVCKCLFDSYKIAWMYVKCLPQLSRSLFCSANKNNNKPILRCWLSLKGNLLWILQSFCISTLNITCSSNLMLLLSTDFQHSEFLLSNKEMSWQYKLSTDWPTIAC